MGPARRIHGGEHPVQTAAGLLQVAQDLRRGPTLALVDLVPALLRTTGIPRLIRSPKGCGESAAVPVGVARQVGQHVPD